jgi:hypothetical protein
MSLSRLRLSQRVAAMQLSQSFKSSFVNRVSFFVEYQLVDKMKVGD